jgi:hypothetical protein
MNREPAGFSSEESLGQPRAISERSEAPLLMRGEVYPPPSTVAKSAQRQQSVHLDDGRRAAARAINNPSSGLTARSAVKRDNSAPIYR